MRQAATHSQPIRLTIPPLFSPPVVLVQLINHHQSLEIAIHAPNVNKPNANWPNLNWMRDSRFATLDLIRFDSLRARFILPHQQVEIAFAICFIIYSPRIIFDQAAERAPQETAPATALAPLPLSLHRRLSKCNSAAASAAVNPCHKSAAPGCTKEARENSITESKTGRKLKIKICPNNLQGERTKKGKSAMQKRKEGTT